MPFYVLDAIIRSVAHQPVRLQDAKVLILGVAFKKDVDDTRHSPAIRVIELLQEKGITNISYCDPHVSSISIPTGPTVLDLEALDVTEKVLADHDVAVILTDHSAFPYAMIAEHAQTVVDTRNALKHIPHNKDKVILLGGGEF